MRITKEIEIDMGHRVTNHKSKCASLHGHRYKIEVCVDGEIINISGDSSEGMVIDFGDLKQVMMTVLDKQFDHGMVLWDKDPMAKVIAKDKNTKLTIVTFVPTAENLARYWYLLLRPILRKKNIALIHVKVWETPTSTAIHTEDDYDMEFD